MSEADITIVNARAHPALKLLGVKSLYGNSTATYDLRTGVQADASTLFTSNLRFSATINRVSRISRVSRVSRVNLLRMLIAEIFVRGTPKMLQSGADGQAASAYAYLLSHNLFVAD
jgi:hypothetical protein